MNRRLDLSAKLHLILGNDNVYFQPPKTQIIKYPCCIYHLGRGSAKHADDTAYNYVQSYELKFIFKQSNEGFIKHVLNCLTLCSFDRSYTVDGLYHYVFNIYY